MLPFDKLIVILFLEFRSKFNKFRFGIKLMVFRLSSISYAIFLESYTWPSKLTILSSFLLLGAKFSLIWFKRSNFERFQLSGNYKLGSLVRFNFFYFSKYGSYSIEKFNASFCSIFMLLWYWRFLLSILLCFDDESNPSKFLLVISFNYWKTKGSLYYFSLKYIWCLFVSFREREFIA